MNSDGSKIYSYKDLVVWQKAKLLSVEIYKLTSRFPQSELYGLTSQMRRAAVSIPSNIAEGRHRGSKKDFLQFLRIAYGSGAELETQLSISIDLSLITQKQYNEIGELLTEVMKMLRVIIYKFNKAN